MANKRKWKKHIASDIKSFRRPRGSKPPAKAILILTEGGVTEPVYFETVKAKLALATVEIEIIGSGMGDPRKLAEEALKLRKRRKRAAKQNELGFNQAPDFDELWIVFDTDVPVEHGRYHDGVCFAHSNSVQTAESTPCFEYWLLIHFCYTTAPMPKCADVIPKLEKQLGASYSKNAKESAQLIPPMVEKLETACEHALRVRKHHEEAGTDEPPNPSTRVDLLIDALNGAASPANQ